MKVVARTFRLGPVNDAYRTVEARLLERSERRPMPRQVEKEARLVYVVKHVFDAAK